MARSQLTEKLNRLKRQIGGISPSEPGAKVPASHVQFAKSLGGRLITNSAGNYCLIRSVYPVGYRHGSHNLTSSLLNSRLPLSAFQLKCGNETVDSRSLLFIDTETTGLGGAGAVAFLIGVGRIIDEGFEVLQYIIPDYSDESSMLEDINALFDEELSVVTFNGASFDLPLLIDRLIINRVGRKIKFNHHLDLLHASRRLFKRRLQSCTLTNLERNLFDFHRTNDIPGYLVPSVYFDWLNDDNLSMMDAVIEHNRLDIVSLLFLSQNIAEAYSTNGSCLEYSEDLHSLSKWYERRKEREKIEIAYTQSEKLPGKICAEAILFYARSFKRLKKFDESRELLSEIAAEDSRHGFSASVELAMHYEHRTREFHKALEHADQAGRFGEISDCHKTGLKKRIKRLKSKIRKSKLAAGDF